MIMHLSAKLYQHSRHMPLNGKYNVLKYKLVFLIHNFIRCIGSIVLGLLHPKAILPAFKHWKRDGYFCWWLEYYSVGKHISRM